MVVGARKGQAVNFVVANEVHVGADGAGNAHQLLCVFALIIEAAEQDVLERDFATGLSEPLLARGKKFGHG